MGLATRKPLLLQAQGGKGGKVVLPRDLWDRSRSPQWRDMVSPGNLPLSPLSSFGWNHTWKTQWGGVLTQSTRVSLPGTEQGGEGQE